LVIGVARARQTVTFATALKYCTRI
jgi:hypothetical protein